MGLTLCKGDYYELSHPNGLPQLIALAIYLCLTIFYIATILCTNRSIQTKSYKILIPIYSLLCLNLCLHCIKLPGGIHPFCYYKSIYVVIMNLVPFNKEIVLLCILMRFWELLSILEDERKYKRFFIPITKYGIILYVVVTTGILTWKNFGLHEDYIYFYYGLEQILIVSIFGFAVVKLFLYFPSDDSSGRYLKWFGGYLVAELLIRLTYNLWLAPKMQEDPIAPTINLIIMALTDVPFYIIIPLALLSNNCFMNFLLKGTELKMNKGKEPLK